MNSNHQKASIYVHMPWCKRKCPYCDFNSFKAPDMIDEKSYIKALINDLDFELAPKTELLCDSVYIGGGTPNLFSGRSIKYLMNGIRSRVALNSDVEITMEVNPESVNRFDLDQYIAAGINRISLGVQSFNSEVLKGLGRAANENSSVKAYQYLREAGFNNVNLDLIFGGPSSSKKTDLKDLSIAVSMNPEHLSWYQLTIEEGTAFFLNPPILPGDDEIYRSFSTGINFLSRQEFERYEVSAYSRKSFKSQHNLNYWNYGDYIGIGAGAHGKRRDSKGIYRTEKPQNPRTYVKSYLSSDPDFLNRRVKPEEALEEYFINVTRLKDGFNEIDLFRKTEAWGFLEETKSKIDRAIKSGFLERTGPRLKPSDRGFMFLNNLQEILT